MPKLSSGLSIALALGGLIKCCVVLSCMFLHDGWKPDFFTHSILPICLFWAARHQIFTLSVPSYGESLFIFVVGTMPMLRWWTWTSLRVLKLFSGCLSTGAPTTTGGYALSYYYLDWGHTFTLKKDNQILMTCVSCVPFKNNRKNKRFNKF